ncbi:NADH-quinone oxidoreductase subunit NuoE [Paraglaciecola polaris]|uniref:NADH-quinone oxidoreductase subunit E n=1 Tax=Paraglaciecola polaris LMG 21857 TaxID=1129793 RepID=K7AH76_9ALTE|nr:NADH-quinone oxidoreductase subunit NuoE [Paraglaciecola polaris]GAC34615.1 NADH-quinone oxidoreductase subunit E [Paraglaciecola polaris LMG 21857]
MSKVIPIKQVQAYAEQTVDYRQVLSQSEIDAIEHECALYESRPAAAIDALQIVQRERRWISDESLYAIADMLCMSATALEGIATFYNLIYRQPVGQHVIHLCNSISCWLNDFQTIADHLRNTLNVEFGQTTSDGNITLLPNVCLGCCNKAPALMLDGELIENLDIASIDKLLQSLGGGKNE